MTQMLRLSDKEYKITLITILRSQKEKNIQQAKKMGNISREIDILKKTEKEMLEVKTTVRRIKNASDGLINRCVKSKTKNQ